jgi:hypothetical protein
MLKKYREKISQAMHLAFYPWGVDKEFDEQSSKSFLRFLDVISFYVLNNFGASEKWIVMETL